MFLAWIFSTNHSICRKFAEKNPTPSRQAHFLPQLFENLGKKLCKLWIFCTVIMWSKYSAENPHLAESLLLLYVIWWLFILAFARVASEKYFLVQWTKTKKYWCFVLPWFSMSVEIEAQQQSSLQWGYKVSWLSICWTWIPHLQNSKVRRRPVWVVLPLPLTQDNSIPHEKLDWLSFKNLSISKVPNQRQD